MSNLRVLSAAFAVLLSWMVPARAAPEPAAQDDDHRCLALNVYFEARSESRTDQQAIAHLTLNRVADSGFPDSVCDVVRQGDESPLHRCQFSWWCDGKGDVPEDSDAWKVALEVAAAALAGRSKDPTGGALYFHGRGVEPSWAETMRQVAEIGEHLYYR